MACQHQLHYISMTGVAQGSQGGLHQAGNTFLFPQSEIFVKYLRAKSVIIAPTKVFADIAESVYFPIQFLFRLLECNAAKAKVQAVLN